MLEQAAALRTGVAMVDDDIAIQRARQRARRSGPGVSEGAHTIVAQLVTTFSSGERLLAAIAAGADSYSLVSDDGKIAVRVRVAVKAVQVPEERLGTSGVVVDWSQKVVSDGASRVSLSQTELRLLAALVDRAGTVVSRAELIKAVWPRSESVREKENGLQVYVCGLRKHLAAVGLRSALQTAKGVGYRLLV